jgi:hypothetical protein
MRGVAGEPFDALQLSISPTHEPTGTLPEQTAERYEFLFAGTEGKGRCFLLATPETKLAEVGSERSLEPLAYNEAQVVVARRDGVTYYECAVPFSLMRERIRPSEGREFCLSLLVHDPDGTGIRDWGEAAGLWPWQRNPYGWSEWPGANWGDEPPLEPKSSWGLCSSKY